MPGEARAARATTRPAPGPSDASAVARRRRRYAFLTIFQSISLEGWVDVMYFLSDAGETAVRAYSSLMATLRIRRRSPTAR